MHIFIIIYEYKNIYKNLKKEKISRVEKRKEIYFI